MRYRVPLVLIPAMLSACAANPERYSSGACERAVWRTWEHENVSIRQMLLYFLACTLYAQHSAHPLYSEVAAYAS